MTYISKACLLHSVPNLPSANASQAQLSAIIINNIFMILALGVRPNKLVPVSLYANYLVSYISAVPKPGTGSSSIKSSVSGSNFEIEVKARK